MQSVNVASIAVLTTLGVSYVLDKIKDKQDKNLREELKDRVESNLKDSVTRIRALETEQDGLKNQMMTREQVDKLVAERLEQMENGRVVGDAKNRALNLKLRSS